MNKIIALFSTFLVFFASCKRIVTREIVEILAEEGIKNAISDTVKKSDEFDSRIFDSLKFERVIFLDGNAIKDKWLSADKTYDNVSTINFENGKTGSSFLFPDELFFQLVALNNNDSISPLAELKKNGDGKFHMYHPKNKKLYLVCNYKNRRKEGNFQSFYSDGSLHEKGEFHNGNFVKEFTEYYPNKAVKLLMKLNQTTHKTNIKGFYINGALKFDVDLLNGKLINSKEFDCFGKVLNSVKLERDSLKCIKVDYFGDQIIAKRSYFKEMKHGKFLYYFENAKKKAIEFYNLDKLISEIRWYENGKPKLEMNYVNEKINGISKEYYESGKVKIIAEYKEGALHGHYASYYENGKIYTDGQYQNGYRFGRWKVYEKDGTLKSNKLH